MHDPTLSHLIPPRSIHRAAPTPNKSTHPVTSHPIDSLPTPARHSHPPVPTPTPHPCPLLRPTPAPAHSLLFVLACFVNGIYTVHGSPAGYGGFAMACRLVQTNSAMLGSCGFLVGSFLFVPEVEHGCPTQTITIATWLFFGSSVLLVLSGLLVLFGPRPSRASSLSISADSSALQALGSSPAAGGAGQKGPSTAVELTNAAHAGGPL